MKIFEYAIKIKSLISSIYFQKFLSYHNVYHLVFQHKSVSTSRPIRRFHNATWERKQNVNANRVSDSDFSWYKNLLI